MEQELEAEKNHELDIFLGGFSDDSEHVNYVVAHYTRENYYYSSIFFSFSLFIRFGVCMWLNFSYVSLLEREWGRWRKGNFSGFFHQISLPRSLSSASGLSQHFSHFISFRSSSPFLFPFAAFAVTDFSRHPTRNYYWVISSASWTRMGRSYLHTQFFSQSSAELSSRHKETSSALSIIFNWIFRSDQDGDKCRARRWRWRVTSTFFYGFYWISSSGPRLN